jgi:uncharacterized protein YjbI with pentapeptide repeats
MANEEHLAILRRGVEAWNTWREERLDVRPDLRGVDLRGVDLRVVDLRGADLSWANLRGANLRGASLRGADLSWANLIETNLIETNLIETNLREAELREATLNRATLNQATLSRADLSGADVSWSNLIEANLSGADLRRANLSGADLSGADLSRAVIGYTIFADNHLSAVNGLDTLQHHYPSTIGIDTLYKSNGKISEVFLRGCGMPDSFIEYLPSLIGAMQPIQFYSCFISYTTKDEAFARRLHGRMQQEHLRVWFAPEDIKAGQKVHEQIEEAIRVYDKIVVILSRNSLQSKWVMDELRRARKAELAMNRRKLFPIRLMAIEGLRNWECIDLETEQDIANEVRAYHLPDFSRWKQHDAFETAFARLLRDLKAVDEPPVPAPPLTLVNKKRQLRILEQQHARQGDYTPLHVIMEIEDLRRAIAEAEGG